MKRLVYSLALLALLPTLLVACDDDETPAPRDAGRDAVADGSTDTTGAKPDVPASADVNAETSGDVRDGGVGDVTGEGGVDAFTPPDAGPGELAFVANLSGAEENPPVATTATGSATFVLNAAKTELRFQLRHNVANVTAGHLHIGWPGENGAVAIPFMMPPGSDISGTLAITAPQAADLEAGHMYANIHSTANAGGEIRGQVLRPGETVFVATLTGSQETPPVTTTAKGKASVILNATKTSLHFHASTSGLVPTAAHFHKGLARVAGGVVYALPTAAEVDGNQAVTPTDVTDLETGLWYVNFHTAANAGGEIRGQLLPPGAKIFAATLTGAQEVPPVTSTFTGNGMAIVPYARNQVQYHLTTTATPSNAHFHRGAGGVSGPVVIPISPLGMSMSGVAALTPELASDMERGFLYMNVHTAANPGGELRGQVIGIDETLYTAVLTGAEETPPVTTTATGGLGVMVNAAGTQLRYAGSFTMITASAAHFHAAAAGVAGPVVYSLTYTGMVIEGTQAILPADLTALDAGGWYANVHTAANPNGEIRGQVLKK